MPSQRILTSLLISCRHVGLLSIQGEQFQMAEMPLKTVRPFEMDEVVLTEMAQIDKHNINLEDKDTITAFLRGQVGLFPLLL